MRERRHKPRELNHAAGPYSPIVIRGGHRHSDAPTRLHNQSCRASGSIKPMGPARPSAAREPAPPLVLRRTLLLAYERCSETQALVDINDRSEQEKRGGAQDPPGHPGQEAASKPSQQARRPSLARGGLEVGVSAVPGAIVLIHNRRRSLSSAKNWAVQQPAPWRRTADSKLT